jgi:hypothetical protein
MGLLNRGGVNDMAPMYTFKYRGQRIQIPVTVDELLLKQDCLRSGACRITPRTRHTFSHLSRLLLRQSLYHVVEASNGDRRHRFSRH